MTNRKGRGQSAYVFGIRFDRLRSKMLRCGYDLQRVDRNLARHSRYNDQEAWEGISSFYRCRLYKP